METNENEIYEAKPFFAKCIIIEAVIIIITILFLLSVKYFDESTFNTLKKWYGDNVCVDTSTTEVLGDK